MKIDLNSEHKEIDPSGLAYFFIWVIRFFYLGLGFIISYFILYKECLHDEKVNSIVTTFFSVLALSCFSGFGLQIVNIPLPTLKKEAV